MAGGLVELTQTIAVAAEGAENGIVTQETVSPGGIGFFLFLALGVGTFLLWRSLNRQLKRIDFDEEPNPGRPVVDLTDPRGASGTGAQSTSDSRDSEG